MATSLFGPTLAETQQGIEAADAERFRQDVAAFRPDVSLPMAGGQAFARAFSQAVSAEDPRLRVARANEDVRRRFLESGLDISTPAGEEFLVQAFLDHGLLDSAINARTVSQQLQQQIAKTRESQATASLRGTEATVAGATAGDTIRQATAAADKAVFDAILAHNKVRGTDQASVQAAAAEKRAIEKHIAEMANKNFKNENDLAKSLERNPIIGEAIRSEQGLSIVEPAFRAHATASDAVKAQLDLQMIIGFYKTVDPSSTVTGGETEAAARGSDLDSVKQWFALLREGGGRLLPEQRRQLIQQVRGIANQRRSNVARIKRRATETANKRGLDVDSALAPIIDAEGLMAAAKQRAAQDRPIPENPPPEDVRTSRAREGKESAEAFMNTAAGIMGGVLDARIPGTENIPQITPLNAFGVVPLLQRIFGQEEQP